MSTITDWWKQGEWSNGESIAIGSAMAGRQLFWLAAGLLAWFAIRTVSPKIAGYVLAAFVIGALVIIAPQIKKLPKL